MCFLLGARLLSLFRSAPDALAERALLSLGLGYVAFGYVVLLIGLVGQLYTSRILAAALLCVAVSWTELGFLRRCLAALWARTSGGRLDSLSAALYGFVAVWLLLGLLNALAPPGWQDWDGLSHHLAVPREYIRHHRIAYVPWTSHSNFPYATQMLFTVGLMLRGPAAAKLFHFAYAPLSLIALGALSRRFLPAGCGPFAAAVYCCIPIAGWLAGLAYVDLGVAFFTILAVHFLLAWALDGEARGLGWAGLACGLGMCIKMQMGMVLGAVLCLAVLAMVLRRERLLVGVGRIAAAAGIAAAVCWPWYLKSFVWTGNPVYPFAYGLFGGHNFSAAEAAAYAQHQKHFGMPPPGAPADWFEESEEPSPRSLRHLLLLPWNVTVHPRYFLVKRTQAYVAYAGDAIGPMFLAFLVPLAFVRGKPPGVSWALGFVGVFVLAWFFVMQLARYLLPCLAIACIPVAYCLRLCWDHGGVVRGTAVALLLMSCVSGVGGLLFVSLPNVGAAVGLESAREYLYETLEVYRASQRINAFTPPTAKVATYGEPRVFYIEREAMWADPGHHQMIRYAEMTTGEQLVARLRELGVTHVLLAPTMVERLGDPSDSDRLLLLLRDAFRERLLSVPEEFEPTMLDRYVIAVVRNQDP